ncbi:MAG: pyridoxamine 5'-phosphate oxidase family protein [Acidobacteriota bacterium]|nr:pyridoxamine 5'-phosphate oxidase family protein [Acidobacteriota bacterium]
MAQTLESHWPQIRRTFAAALGTSFHFSMASVDDQGNPHISPIGSLRLDKNRTRGYYFELFTKKMPRNFQTNQRVCVMAVPSRIRSWLSALIRGRFKSPPGVRLYGTVGEVREATPEEKVWWERRTGILRFLKGYKILWSDLSHVREIHFDDWAPVNLGPMTQGCWDSRSKKKGAS